MPLAAVTDPRIDLITRNPMRSREKIVCSRRVIRSIDRLAQDGATCS
jgi:hypothetical protein